MTDFLNQFLNFMKISKSLLKKILLPGLGILLLTIVIGWVSIKQKSVKCTEVVIKLVPEDGTYFLSNSQVLKIASNTISSNDLIGRKIKDLNTYQMLFNLTMSPYVEKANVFMGHNGVLQIDVIQREPLFRVINQQGESYYVEKNGMKIPYMPRFSVRAPVLTGNVVEMSNDSTHIQTEELLGAHAIFSIIASDPFWQAQIEQCHVDKNQDYILIPKVGNHTIVVGKPEHLEVKFEKLKLFYNQALSKLGWDEYSEINVSFEGQVVAKRRN